MRARHAWHWWIHVWAFQNEIPNHQVLSTFLLWMASFWYNISVYVPTTFRALCLGERVLSKLASHQTILINKTYRYKYIEINYRESIYIYRYYIHIEMCIYIYIFETGSTKLCFAPQCSLKQLHSMSARCIARRIKSMVGKSQDSLMVNPTCLINPTFGKLHSTLIQPQILDSNPLIYFQKTNSPHLMFHSVSADSNFLCEKAL